MFVNEFNKQFLNVYRMLMEIMKSYQQYGYSNEDIRNFYPMKLV